MNFEIKALNTVLAWFIPQNTLGGQHLARAELSTLAFRMHLTN